MNTSDRLTKNPESPPSAPMAPSLPERIARLRMKTKELAQLSGVGENTLINLLRQRNEPREATMRVIEQAVAAEEISLRDYLVSIHGVPNGEGR